MRSSLAERICVSLLPRSLAELREMWGRALELGAKLVELRLDGLPANKWFEAARLADEFGVRRIFTLRPSREGGLYDGDEERRLEALLSVSHKADYVDVEHETMEANPQLVDEIKGIGVKVISSRHYFSGTPTDSELRRVVAEGLRSADIVKVVNNPVKASEAFSLLSLYSETGLRGRLVCFSMGERWSLTRLLSLLLGAPFTYASLPGQAVAPGQLSLTETIEALEVLSKSWLSSPF